MPIMKIEKLAVANVRENVAIGYHEGRFGTPTKKADRAGGSKRRLFAQILDLDIEAASIAEVLFYHVPEIVDRQHKAAKTLGLRTLDDVFKYWLAVDLQQGLGAILGQRMQSLALSSHHEDHRVWPL